MSSYKRAFRWWNWWTCFLSISCFPFFMWKHENKARYGQTAIVMNGGTLGSRVKNETCDTWTSRSYLAKSYFLLEGTKGSPSSTTREKKRERLSNYKQMSKKSKYKHQRTFCLRKVDTKKSVKMPEIDAKIPKLAKNT